MDSMVSLTKALVPNYLVGSEFYNSLSADDEEVFSIPRKFLKPNVSVASGAELAHLFHTMKFWGMMRLPDEILELIVFKSRWIPEHETGPIRDVLSEFDAEFKLSLLHDRLFSTSSTKSQRLNAALASGREDALEYVIRKDGQMNTSIIRVAAESGLSQLLKRITNDFTAPNGKSPFEKVSMVNVARGGHLACLRYLLENGCKKEKFTCNAAAENGHLACLKIAREHGCTWNQSVLNAEVGKGQLECVKYAMEYISKDKIAEAACFAAECGQVACLEYMLDQGIKPSKRICRAACGHRGSDCLRLLRARGASLDIEGARRAAMSGNLSSLQFLLDEGCKVDSSVFREAVEWKRDQCLDLLLAKGCVATGECVNLAARIGHLSCVKVFRKFNVPLREEQIFDEMHSSFTNTKCISTLWEARYAIPQCAIVAAIRNGDDECLEYMCANRCCPLTTELTIVAASTGRAVVPLKILRTYKCPWGPRVCARVARIDDLAGLRFAHEHGCPWDASTVAAALQGRGEQCLEYALNHGCPVCENACELAAKHGLFDILQRLHEQGCELTLATCVAAAMYRQTDCLNYAVAHGAPVDESVCVAAVSVPSSLYKGTQLRMLQFARELGCPWSQRVSHAAAESGHVPTLRYCVEHGCPISKATMEVYNSCI